ncbi:protein CD300H-like isoform X4 [Triplophysa rosa]|uniref:protein CD300H-like isoform X4 n=1 Tax=Triplophysa rosa TaxID=992332 RepID=UPI002545F0BC|nr:protein CD300H-like isoform X4 [Triplophysa rosa]
MATLMKIVCLFIVFRDVLMKSGNVYEGTVGQTVEIRCPVPDEYKYTQKYFCRDPCKHVLIQTERTDQVVSDRKYSVIFNMNAKTFSVTIKHLTLKDSGVYYCGLDEWFHDKLIKVKLSVKVFIPAPVSSFSSTGTPKYTDSTWTKTNSSAAPVFSSHTPESTFVTWTITHTAAGKSSSGQSCIFMTCLSQHECGLGRCFHAAGVLGSCGFGVLQQEIKFKV